MWINIFKNYYSTERHVHWYVLLRNSACESAVAESCLPVCDPMDCSPPGFPVHGILQARILEWVAISYSRGSSQLRDQTWVFHITGTFFIFWATREARETCLLAHNCIRILFQFLSHLFSRDQPEKMFFSFQSSAVFYSY